MTLTGDRFSSPEASQTVWKAQLLSLGLRACPKREATGIGQRKHPRVPKEPSKKRSRSRTLRSLAFGIGLPCLGASPFNYHFIFYVLAALLQILDEILIRLKHLRGIFGYFVLGVVAPIRLEHAKRLASIYGDFVQIEAPHLRAELCQSDSGDVSLQIMRISSR